MPKDGGFLLPEVINPPMRCVSFEIPDDQNHMMAFWGALNELTYWYNWQRDAAHTAKEVSYLWLNIIQAAHDRFLSDNPCGNELPTEDCRELAPHHPAIEWYPHNPYIDPNWTGPGYAIGAWYVAQDAGLIDATPGSVVTDLAHVRVGVGDNAEFRLRVTGIGEVELHLANVFSGGMGIIRVDGDIVDSVDMSQDATSVPPETENVTIWEWAFTTEGAHEIIVNIVPVVDDALTPPLRYGGGLVKVSLCGFAPTEANHVIRVMDCVLQQSSDGVNWTDVADLAACMPAGEPGADGASPEMRVSDGYIQWRQDDDDPTWTNLVALLDLKGEQGEPGEQGIQGEPGEQGIAGPIGPVGPAGPGGNVYPDAPIVGPEVCGAATYIVEQVRGLITDVYMDLATIDPDDIIQSLLFQNGWNAVELMNFVFEAQGSLANETAILAAYDADSDDMICQLQTHALSQEFIISWANTAFASYTAVRPLVIAAINAAATDGRWALWATIGAQNEVECPEDCDTPELALVILGGFDASLLEFIETTADGDVYELTTEAEFEHYNIGGAVSVGSVPFYIINVEVVTGTWEQGSIATNSGTYGADNVPCWLATTSIGLYTFAGTGDKPLPGDKIRITIASQPCHETYLRPRVDGDWGGSTFTTVFIGFDGSGNVIYDVTNTSSSGNMKVGFDTVDEPLTTLKSAYLVSATPPPGETISYWSFEQADRDGVVGVGASGTVSSKKWAFYGMSGYNKTIRVVLSANPY